jgi:hypothetical protein
LSAIAGVAGFIPGIKIHTSAGNGGVGHKDQVIGMEEKVPLFLQGPVNSLPFLPEVPETGRSGLSRRLKSMERLISSTMGVSPSISKIFLSL